MVFLSAIRDTTEGKVKMEPLTPEELETLRVCALRALQRAEKDGIEDNATRVAHGQKPHNRLRATNMIDCEGRITILGILALLWMQP